MSLKNNGLPVIVNAIVWAALMIATSLIMSDASADQKSMLLLWQIAGWFAVQSVIIGKGRSLKEEWACIRHKLGKNS